MRTFRILLIAATTVATMAVTAGSASAQLTANDAALNPDLCPNISGTYGSQVDFTGGCALTGRAESSVLTVPGSSDLDCAVDADARVAGDGEVAVNGIDVSQNTAEDARCDQTFECDLDEPLTPWAGAITGSGEPYTFTTDVCFTSPLGTFTGPIAGGVTDVSSTGVGQSPLLTFTNAPLENLNPAAPDGSLTATFDIDPDTVYIVP
jgi:hypothetical protein